VRLMKEQQKGQGGAELQEQKEKGNGRCRNGSDAEGRGPERRMKRLHRGRRRSVQCGSTGTVLAASLPALDFANAPTVPAIISPTYKQPSAPKSPTLHCSTLRLKPCSIPYRLGRSLSAEGSCEAHRTYSRLSKMPE